MLPTTVAMLFVVAIVAFAAYALVRPFTHVHHHHDANDRLWRPLD
jgi:flagellar biogenesis protein FliO